MTEIKMVDCPDCDGKGEFWSERIPHPDDPNQNNGWWLWCENCQGTGQVQKDVQEEDD